MFSTSSATASGTATGATACWSWKTATGGPTRSTGEDLGGLLSEYDQTRLAVLNACEGARSDDASDPFAGTAQSLIQQGLPAVVAMQFEITDDAAIIFARELYAAIADGYPLEAALAEARRAILHEGNLTEWATPVLYSRAPDGHLFNLTGQVRIPEADRRAREEAEQRAQEEADRRAREEAEQDLRPPSDAVTVLIAGLACTLTGHKGGLVYHAV